METIPGADTASKAMNLAARTLSEKGRVSLLGAWNVVLGRINEGNPSLRGERFNDSQRVMFNKKAKELRSALLKVSRTATFTAFQKEEIALFLCQTTSNPKTKHQILFAFGSPKYKRLP